MKLAEGCRLRPQLLACVRKEKMGWLALILHLFSDSNTERILSLSERLLIVYSDAVDRDVTTNVCRDLHLNRGWRNRRNLKQVLASTRITRRYRGTGDGVVGIRKGETPVECNQVSLVLLNIHNPSGMIRRTQRTFHLGCSPGDNVHVALDIYT